MDNQAFQEGVKSDLRTIPTLKMGILSARDLYGTLATVILKTSLIFLSLNTLVQFMLKAFGLYYPKLSVGVIFCTWVFALGASLLIGILLSQYILFGKLVKGRLKTETFIKKKCRYFTGIYFLMYGVIYAVFVMGLGAFSKVFDDSPSSTLYFFWDILFPLGFAQLASFVAATVIMSFLANMEIERLGVGVVFEVINQFVAKLKNRPLIEVSTNGGSDE